MGSDKIYKYQIKEEECKSLTLSENAKHEEAHSPKANMSHEIAHVGNILSVK